MREGVGQQTASELDQIKGVLRADSIQDRLMPYLKDAAVNFGSAPVLRYVFSGRRSITPN
jgi:hypothetical protein